MTKLTLLPESKRVKSPVFCDDQVVTTTAFNLFYLRLQKIIRVVIVVFVLFLLIDCRNQFNQFGFSVIFCITLAKLTISP
jgi:hypothetical protein